MLNIATGGFLKGHRTYILSALGVLAAIANYAVGDFTITEAFNAAVLALGLGTLRAAK
jgi:hypothetical protein